MDLIRYLIRLTLLRLLNGFILGCGFVIAVLLFELLKRVVSG